MKTGDDILKIINIGILAHVDAGKTTVTEHLLYKSGAIREIGRVDNGNTQTDTMELERQRGISIKSATISLNWKDTKVNIIDTPGHVDFISEVERSLSILDGAILVISAREGIQSQTKVLFDTLKRLSIPTIIFVNKLDRVGCDYKGLLKELNMVLSDKIVPLQGVNNEGDKDFSIYEFDQDTAVKERIIDVISSLDDRLLEAYINHNQLSTETIENSVSEFTSKGLVYPIICGSALQGIGITKLLDSMVQYFLPYDNNSNALSGVVFKIKRDSNNWKQTFVRLYSGSLSVRQTIKTYGKETEEKIKQICTLKKGQIIDDNVICPGDIGILYGPQNLKIGDIIGEPLGNKRSVNLARPVLKSTVQPKKNIDRSKLFTVLTILAEEDPLLDLEIGELQDEIYLNLFGTIQMEILKTLLENNHGLDVEFSEPRTIYKETPKSIGTAFTRMWDMSNSNPYPATVGLKVEPIGRGEGFIYVSEVTTGFLPRTFQNAIEEAVLSTALQGLQGWEVTDMKVTLTHGEYDSVYSSPSDFRNLTPMVLMEALDNAKTLLLEPYYDFELNVPAYAAGRALSDLQRMRGEFTQPILTESQFKVAGLIPVDTSNNYPITLASYTEGKGVFHTRFYGYKEDYLNLGKPREKTTVDPLNKKLYLMHKMNTFR